MAPKLCRTLLILTLASLSSCASVLPEMDHKITVYKGCPEVEGICQKSKAEVKQEVVAALNSVPADQVSEWVEQNVNGVRVKFLPAKSKQFSKFVALSAEDLGVILKYINDLKRKIVP